MEKPTVISKGTLIPLGAAAVIFGVASWITTIYAQGHENTKNIDRIYEKLDRIEEKIDKLKEKQK
jgi:hypothetical protein